MARPLPDCPTCDVPTVAIRADGKGYVWAGCPTCRQLLLIHPDGHIVHRGTDR